MEIEKIQQNIDQIPWSRLAHAYHRASDAPEMLGEIIRPESEDEFTEAMVLGKQKFHTTKKIFLI